MNPTGDEMMIILYILLGIFLLVCIVHLRTFYSPGFRQGNIFNIPGNAQYAPYKPIMEDLIRDLDARPYEEIWIRSHDGLRLFARYYHHADGAPVDIAFHGYRGTAQRDMCGGFQISRMAGHNVLLVDQRAHGKSAGHCLTFGIKERFDCRTWIDYARKRFGEDVPILLYGVSMGAATVLMASGLKLPGNVRGIVADCPYSSPKDIIRKVCRDMHLPWVLVYPLIAASAKIFGAFRLTEASAAEAVQHSRIPTLIIHGEDDRFVPPEMSACIASARPDIERITFPDAGHGISGIVHIESYNRAVLDFIQRSFR